MAEKAKVNVYQLVTDRIIAELENGTIPWQKPWTGVRGGAFNRISKKPYSLLNQMLLRRRGEYASFKQWKELGGHVKKGAKSEMVVFWKILPVEKEDKDGKKVKKTVPLLRYYNVFHISQVEGVEPLEQPENDVEPVREAEDIISDYVSREKVGFEEAVGDEAFYSPSSDTVVVPCKGQFMDVNKYYATVFHELVHSTGHKTRLDRFSDGKAAAFGSDVYSKEELVAEIGSADIMNAAGMETESTFKNNASYIQNWLAVLKNDNKFIVSASAKAEKAVDLILGAAGA